MMLGVVLLISVQAGAVLAQDGFLSMSTLVEDSTAYVSGRVVVRYANLGAAKTQIGLAGPRSTLGISSAVSRSLMAGARVDRDLSGMVSGLCAIELPAGMSVQHAIRQFSASPQVAYAEPDYLVTTSQEPVIPSDARFPEQWALDNFYNTDINAPEAWGEFIAEAPDIIVAVVDTGVDYKHPDLEANMWYDPNVPDTFDAADPNTYPDPNDYPDFPDIVFDANFPEEFEPWWVYGYDFVDDDSDPNDEHFHGTHVAGIIGAVGNNGEGIAGVAHVVTLMAIRVMANDPNNPGQATGSVGDIVSGMEFAAENGANIVNLSLGSSASFIQAFYDACVTLGDSGILVVAAAGNEGVLGAGLPARYGTVSMGFQRLENVVSVAATTINDTLASFSNYGEEYTLLGAPGQSILSCTPRIINDIMDTFFIAPNYDVLSGTSQAAPHVSGAAALAMALNPDITAADIQRRLASPRSVEPTLAGLTESGGRLNLYKFLQSLNPGEVRNMTQGISYAWDELQRAIEQADDGDDIICQFGRVYPVEEPLTYLGKNLRLRSGDIEDEYYEPNRAEIGITAIWGPRDEGPVIYLDVADGSDLANASLEGFAVEYGEMELGGIQMIGVLPHIHRCIIQNNIGGGIVARGGALHFTDGEVRNNLSRGSGGGLYASQADWATIENSTITNNMSSAGFGGGVAIDETLEATITNSTFVNNDAAWAGGGLCLYEVTATVTKCAFSENSSSREGGAVYSQGTSEITLQDSTFTNNYAEVAGGAMFCEENDTALMNNLFVGNEANGQYGGAMYCVDSSPTVGNCTFVGNDVLALEGVGGAVFCQTGYFNIGSSPVISDCIFADNNDIAIVEGDEKSQPTVRYSLFHNNPRGDFYDVDSGTSFLVSAPEAGIIVSGEANFNDDPMFVPGRLGTYYLSQFAAGQILDVNGVITTSGGDPNRATSPAVDAGSDLAETLGMQVFSTRTDNFADPNTGHRDDGTVDLGYHYDDAKAGKMFAIIPTSRPRNIGELTVLYPDDGFPLYKQYSQVHFQAAPVDVNYYQQKGWSGTDDDGRLDLDAAGMPLPVQENLTTIALHLTPAEFDGMMFVPIGFEFETILVEMVAYVDSEDGDVTPERGFYPRGSTVELQVDTDVHPVRARWFGTDDDTRLVKTNTVTMEPPYATNPKGRERKEVRVSLYKPRILRVPSHDYVTINEAIHDTNDGDIVSLAESDVPYYTFEGFYIDREITITGENPSDPNSVARTVIEMMTLGAGPVGNAFTFVGVGRNTIINGLTIRGFQMNGGYGGDGTTGFHPAGKGGDMPGPAMLLMGASPVIKNCVFVNNLASGGDGGDGFNSSNDAPAGRGGWPGHALGGAMAVLSGSDPCIVNCAFAQCVAQGGDGGDGGNLPPNTAFWPGPGGGWDPRWNETWPGGAQSFPEEFWLFDPVGWIDSDGGFPSPDLDLPYTGLGGAVYVDRFSSPVFRNCTFSECFAGGGRVGLSGTYPSGARHESKVNWQIDSFGGAVFVGQYMSDLFFFGPGPGGGMGDTDISKARFVECAFTNNIAGTDPNAPVLDLWTSYGGAVAVGQGADPSFERCTFTNNNADMGGGLYVSDKSSLTLTNSTVSQNTAFSGGGLAGQEAMISLFTTAVTDNVASHEDGILLNDPNIIFSDDLGRGGALFVEDTTTLVKDSQLMANEAGASGGAIYSAGSDPVLIHNSLIYQNQAGREGGGIAATLFAETEIRNSTIMNNLVEAPLPLSLIGRRPTGYGGGLYTTRDSVTHVYDSLLWGNIASPTDANNTGDQIAVRSGFEWTDDYRGPIGEGEPNDTGLEYSEDAARVYIQHSDIGPSIHSEGGPEGDIGYAIWPVYQEDPARVFGWDADAQAWDPNTYNLSENPRLTAGFYLSHIAAGQSLDSPLIDAGSKPVDDPNILLQDYTTRTDGIADMGIVDIGYHYPYGIRSYELNVLVSPSAEDGLIHGQVDPNYKVVFDGIGSNTVLLTAIPDAGYRVRGWSGTDNDSLTSRTNTVTVTEDTVARVGFEKLSSRKLTVPGDYPTIQEAITVARDGDEVIVEPGTYYAPGSGTNGYSLTIDKAVTLRSVNPEDPCMVAATIIDGYGTINANQSMLGVLFGRNSTGALVNGLTIQNCTGKAGDGDDGDRDLGHPNGGDGGFIIGGGMYIAEGAGPIIKNCIIRNCQLEGGDGGVGVDAVSDDDPLFTYNAGRGGWSGFVHGAGAFCAKNSRPSFINCIFENNMARGGVAGDGGSYDDGSLVPANASYGGNYSPTDYTDYDPCEYLPTPSPVPLWQVWRWDHAFLYEYWDDVMTGDILLADQNDLLDEFVRGGPYLGDYRWYSGYGAGVFCAEGSQATFEHCVFRGNRTYGGQSGVGGTLADNADDLRAPILAYEIPSYGAGVYAAKDSVMTFKGCTFEDNVASDADNVSLFGSPDPNFALDPYLGWGGGVCAEQTAAVTFVDCNFVDNGAQTGGALYLGSTSVDIISSHLTRNIALRGGGIYGDNGDILIRDCNVVANWARQDVNDVNDVNGLDLEVGYGAGLALVMSEAEVWDSNFFANDANNSGGAVYVRGGAPTFINNLFYQNAAGRDGGGMSINAESRPLLRNNTFHNNAALATAGGEGRNGLGGALYAGHGSEVTIIDSIFWQNSALRGGEIAVGSGAEFEPVCSTVNISYSNLFVGQNNSLYEDPGCQIVQGQGMLYTDPQFRNGLLGSYYLAAASTGHGVQSPCIDAGSEMAGKVGLAQTATQTNQAPDKGLVDMGYHHVMREPCRICDLKFDGVIDGIDFALFAERWLHSGCGDPDWCGGADFTFDTRVDPFDMLFFSDCWLAMDVTPPRVNPPSWTTAPSMEAGKISMSARAATDLWGWSVEYYFDCLSGDGHDSGWIGSTFYQDFVADPYASYTYRFKVREARENGNETRWSDSITVHTQETPPIGALNLVSDDTQLTTAALAVIGNMLEHPSGVHYRFQLEGIATTDWMSFPIVPDANIPDDPNQSGVPTWRFTGLEPDTEYRVRYQARTASQSNLPTSWSEYVVIWTLGLDSGIDILPPTPNPMQFADADPNGEFGGVPVAVNTTGGDFSWWVTMTASDLAVDDSGGVIEFFFESNYDSRFNSGWTTLTTYLVETGVNVADSMAFRIKARDEFGNETMWSDWEAVRDASAAPIPGQVGGQPAAGGGGAVAP